MRVTIGLFSDRDFYAVAQNVVSTAMFPSVVGALSHRSERGNSGSWIRTSEKTSSRTFVNKGKKKGRGCYYAPALVRYVALTVRSTHGDGSAHLSMYIHLP